LPSTCDTPFAVAASGHSVAGWSVLSPKDVPALPFQAPDELVTDRLPLMWLAWLNSHSWLPGPLTLTLRSKTTAVADRAPSTLTLPVTWTHRSWQVAPAGTSRLP